ncbi:Heat shock protein DNAJ [Neofusicoccum parvum]|nr:Heat shock protein DNAJ [Neofusicoccum parvum]
MVKADPKRNYYADLEVAPDADAEEIRKQFRKLALKWHPDRNPGREQECVPRFQAIQAAHEILGDPGERQRYDLERRKRGGGGGTGTYTPRQPAPRGNPYQATSNFPPPPRRTGGGRAQPPPRPDYANPHASTGANRYANFPKPPPTQRKEYAAEQKANVFNAWQNMKTKPNAHAGQAESSHQRAKSAWEFAQEQKPGVNRSQSTRMPKRGGFDPTTPGADEPPAASTSSYFTTSNYGRPVPPPPPPPRDAGATRPQQHADPLRQFKEQFTNEATYPEGMRTRTPYNASGGEKIFVDPSHKQESAGANGYPTQNGATNGSNTSNVNGGMGQKSKSSMYDHFFPDKPSSIPSTSNIKMPTQWPYWAVPSSVPPRSSEKSQSSFDFPIDADTFAQTNAEQFKSKSTESINTKFSPGDWHGKFQGSPDYFTGPTTEREEE